MAFNPKRYSRDLFAAFAAYAVVLVGTRVAIRSFAIDGAAAAALAVAPIAPALAVTAVLLKHVATMDELQRRVQVEAFAASAMIVGLVAFAFGFVEGVAATRPSMIWIFPAMLGGAGVIAPILRRRYL